MLALEKQRAKQRMDKLEQDLIDFDASRDNVINSLRERGGSGFGGVRLRKAIVTLQVAFSLVLLIGAALFLTATGRFTP